MDNEIVEGLISNILKHGYQPLIFRFKSLSEIDSSPYRYHGNFETKALEELVNYLGSIPELVEIFDNKMMNVGDGASRVTIDLLSKWLVITSYINDIGYAIELLNSYLKSETTSVLSILVISGIEVSDRIKISDAIELVPFDDLPASVPKESLYPPFFKEDFLSQLGIIPLSINKGFYFPKAALVKRVQISPKSFSNDESVMLPIDVADLYEVCEFLTLFSDATPVPLGSWTELDDSIPCKQMLGSAWSQPVPDVLSVKDVALHHSDWQEIKLLYKNFSNMTQQNRDLLRIPIQRVNQARRRKNIADKAIDQGVAFEALFLNDKSHKEQISFTFRLRASLLLGNTFEKKQELMNFFTSFYSCRSMAVHTGRLDQKIKIPHRRKVHANELLNESDELCIKAIKKIIENGEFPDWNKLVLTSNVNS